MKDKLSLIVLRIWYELKQEKAQDLIEYAMLMGLVSVLCVASLKPVGTSIVNYYSYIHTTFKAAF